MLPFCPSVADNYSGFLLEAPLIINSRIILFSLKTRTVTFEMQKAGSSGTGFSGVTVGWYREYDGFALVKCERRIFGGTENDSR